MKPAFALNITDDRISLLHRTSSGWLEVGGVGLDSAEITETIGYLRSTAQTLDPRGLTCKVVIPNSQILYLSVEAPGPDAASRRAQIRAGLEGRTPYAVDDLVFDWWGKGDTVQVAVVARETLDEAEAFAVSQKLNPMSFVAIPPTSQFGGEPWFGPTAFAPTLLGPGEKIERDQDPIHIVGRAAIPLPASAPNDAEAEQEPLEAMEEAEEPMIPVAVGEPLAVEPDPEPEAPFSEVDEPFEEIEALPAVTAAEIVEPPLADPLPVTETEAPAEPEPVLAETDQKAVKRAAAAAVRNARAAARAEPPRVPPAAPRAPAIGPATRPAGKATRPAAEAISPLEQLTATVKSRGESGKVKASGAMVTAQTIAVPKERRHSPAPEATPAPPAQPRTETEAESMTVFGARRGGTRGKPKYLGLILTAILLGFLAAVAVWSSIFLASWFNPDEPRVEMAAVTADGVAAPSQDTVADQTAGDATAADVASQGTSELPSPEDEALADGQDIDPEAEDMPADAAAVAGESPTETDSGDTTAVAAATPAGDGTSTPADEASATVPTAAATVGTDTTRNPGDEPQDEIFLSTAAPAPATSDAIALAAPLTAPDAVPPAQPDPPPFGTTYQFDAAGRIIPTKEGIVTPEGVMLVAGKPPIVPPVRPAAAAVVAPAATTDALSDLPAATAEAVAPVQVVDPALAKLKPKLRPEGLVPPQTAGQDDDGAALPAETDTRMASLRPRARSAEVFAANNAALEEQQASSAADASLVTAALEDGGSPLAVAVSRKPAPRPIVTDTSIENAVAEAAAMTVALPDPKPAQEPTLALALPEPDPEPVAQPAPKAGKKAAAAPSDDTAAVEADEADTKDAAPNLPTKASVAKKATFANALNLSKTNLIGVYGTPSNRYALVRQPSGRYVKVEVGDRIDGGQVAAITQSELRYVKNGQTVTLSMPRG
ncbi:hypothetical protein L0V05_09210 [Tabrizicola sp. J26]|uniref:hypothetical protein n=1 Tax=Alitabrizicola rongguiensis TaxID=2909234 RepID=UPI001F37B597|nr:hypothetical protein [Tabrizicola rongguiensis]MCF1708991.1 hypothetical protein [Tabrizicola rongguiensis]